MTNVALHPGQPSTLPGWSSVLAVVAHPDDESFGLGAILHAFASSGAAVSVLCLTHGEGSTLHGVTGDLGRLRAAELTSAAGTLGVRSAVLRDHPDGRLSSVTSQILAQDVLDAITASRASGLVVFDPSGVTGHPDHAAATAAALQAAAAVNLPVLGWTLPREVAEALNDEFGLSFVGHEAAEVEMRVPVDRQTQRLASVAHASQAVPTSVLWRRLDLLGDIEFLRWLRPQTPSPVGAPHAGPAGAVAPPAEVPTLRVDYRGGDQFDVAIRGHTVTVDQPVEVGGDDLGPTPTELFLAGLASCVAFYARRYLRRHKLDATGLAVQTSYRMGTKPARVSEVQLVIQVPPQLPPERRAGLLAVASHCTVHESLTTPPAIDIALAATPQTLDTAAPSAP